MSVLVQRRLRLGVIYIVLMVGALIQSFPIFWTFLTSIKPPSYTFALPPVLFFKPTLESYDSLLFSGQHAMAFDMGQLARNSLIVATGSTAITISAAILGAYAISRFKFTGRKFIAFLIIATRMLPPIATAVPIYLLINDFGMTDTHIALITAYTAINIPFAVWMLRGFMDEIPIDLEDAAMIDGCSRLGALFRIVFPLMAPGLAATAVFSFLLSWNDFALALILTNSNAKTLPLIVMSFITEEGILWGPMSAAATLILLPPVLFVIFAQRHLAKGLTMGAVKG
jgi:multiple sugar transport system permease protein